VRVDTPVSAQCSGSGLRVAVITASFNPSVTDGLKAGAVEYLEDIETDEVRVIEAPGAFELPLLAATALTSGYDAVVALGAVIEGETDHYEHVAHRCSEGLMRVSLDFGAPVGFGVLVTRSIDHALERSAPGPENKGRECAMAVMAALSAQRSLTVTEVSR
jgi:6,7-dimethyl-8-ribityllumazine synthase